MKLINKSNLGMYAEEVIKHTCRYYRSKGIAFFEKREIPIKIIKKINENTIVGKLEAKSYVDFFGSYKGKHYEFEVKQTIEDKFNINCLKTHQFEHLKLMFNNNVCSFIIIFFSSFNEFYFLPFKWLISKIQKSKKQFIEYSIIKNECNKIEISFPGILNFINYLN